MFLCSRVRIWGTSPFYAITSISKSWKCHTTKLKVTLCYWHPLIFIFYFSMMVLICSCNWNPEMLDLSCVSHMPFLVILDASHNEITSFFGFQPPKNLTVGPWTDRIRPHLIVGLGFSLLCYSLKIGPDLHRPSVVTLNTLTRHQLPLDDSEL